MTLKSYKIYNGYEVLIEKFNPNKIFYVYVYLDPRKQKQYIYFDDKMGLELEFNKKPFYIGYGKDENSKEGKGSYNRKNAHLQEWSLKKKSHKNNTIKAIIKAGLEPFILLLDSCLFENDAKILEINLIATVGRKDFKKGPLTNNTNGGDGGSGRVVSDNELKLKRKKRGSYIEQYGEEEANRLRIQLSTSHTGHKDKPETIELKRNARKNKSWIDLFGEEGAREAKKRLSESQKKLFETGERIVSENERKRLKEISGGIKVVNPEGIVFDSMSDAQRYYTLKSVTSIAKMLKGKIKNRFGLIYYSHPRRVLFEKISM